MDTVTNPTPLLRYVPATYLGAVQAVAAIEARIAEMQSWPGEFTSEIAAAHAFLMAIRTAFGIHELSEAEIDAAHERAVAELDRVMSFDPAEGSPDPVDVPVALAVYWNRGA